MSQYGSEVQKQTNSAHYTIGEGYLRILNACRWLERIRKELDTMPSPHSLDTLNIMTIREADLSDSLKLLQHPILPLALIGFKRLQG